MFIRGITSITCIFCEGHITEMNFLHGYVRAKYILLLYLRQPVCVKYCVWMYIFAEMGRAVKKISHKAMLLEYFAGMTGVCKPASFSADIPAKVPIEYFYILWVLLLSKVRFDRCQCTWPLSLLWSWP